MFYVAVNVFVAYTHRNVYFIAWATLSALSVLSAKSLLRTLLCCNCVINLMSDE